MLTQVEDRKQHIAHDYEILCSVAPELREIADLETFSWARMMVRETSRRAEPCRSLATRSCCRLRQVASRNFGIAIGSTRTDALGESIGPFLLPAAFHHEYVFFSAVPLADMLNHYRPRQTKWAFDNKRNAFLIHSLTVLNAGQQVYDR